MEYILYCLGIIPGILFLIKGSDYFISGGLSIAKNLHILPVIIGLTVLALGCSFPEIITSIIASVKKNNVYSIDIAINSSIFNIMIIGLCSGIIPIKAGRRFIFNVFPFTIIATIILFGFIIVGSNMNIGGADDYGLASFSGLTMLVLFVLSLVVLINYGLKNRVDGSKAPYPLGLSILYTFVGYIVLMAGSFLISYCVKKTLQIYQADSFVTNFTAIVIITTLPKLAVGIRSASKGLYNILIGSLAGSNIFNILFVPGLSSIIYPIYLHSNGISYIEDIIFLILTNILILVILSKNKFQKNKYGFIMILFYLVYIAFYIGRNYNLLPYISCF